MSLLQNIVTQVVKNAISDDNRHTQKNSQNSGIGGALGGIFGDVLGDNDSRQQKSRTSQGGLGDILGGVLGGGRQSGGQLGDVLGGLLGGQSKSPNDLGSVLGSVIGSQMGGRGSFNKSTLLVALLPVVLGFIQKSGGLSGVLSKFDSNGLGNKAQSWLSIDRDNDGIDIGDIKRLFGNDEINSVCEKTGASQNEVCQGIADLLPQVMDELSPRGNLEDEGRANQEISEILQKL
ncbi:YidB family protein [Moraxella nasovis]|uniref:YidB family protein n=1 Tax=Moraxella nasovis TaxID=2904121 RepID=UPI001F6129E4|nr:YidB family protein [Moraxella nasovis]UNU74069.1 YidB family protein [Moraxella nasovis]